MRAIGSTAWTRKPRGRRAGLELAAEEHHPLAHPDQPVTPIIGGLRAAADSPSVVNDVELDCVAGVADADPCASRVRVLGHVGQRLLHDPKGGELDARRHRRRAGVYGDRDVESGRSRAGGEVVDAVKARRGGLAGGIGRRQTGEAGELGERLVCNGADQPHAVGRTFTVAADQTLGAAGLDRDHTDVVGHRVVQFPGEPEPLVRHRGGRFAFTAALDIERALVACSRDLTIGAHHATDRPRQRHPAKHGGDDAIGVERRRMRARADGDQPEAGERLPR